MDAVRHDRKILWTRPQGLLQGGASGLGWIFITKHRSKSSQTACHEDFDVTRSWIDRNGAAVQSR